MQKKRHNTKIKTHFFFSKKGACEFECFCVGVWFRVSAWRVGAWARGRVGVWVFYLKNMLAVCSCFFFFFHMFFDFSFFFFFQSSKRQKSKLSKTPGGVKFLVLVFISEFLVFIFFFKK